MWTLQLCRQSAGAAGDLYGERAGRASASVSAASPGDPVNLRVEWRPTLLSGWSAILRLRSVGLGVPPSIRLLSSRPGAAGIRMAGTRQQACQFMNVGRNSTPRGDAGWVSAEAVCALFRSTPGGQGRTAGTEHFMHPSGLAIFAGRCRRHGWPGVLGTFCSMQFLQ